MDFSFIVNEVKGNYCLDDGRNAIDPVQLFKYLLLKVIYDLSDRDLVSRAFRDLSFNYFLGLSPEDNVIHPTTLTKFRRLRLKNEDFLDQLISKSIEISIQKGVIASNTIIIDETHTKSAYNAKSPIELLRERSRNLRKKSYLIDETLKEKMPKKYTGSELTDELAYSNELLQTFEKESKVASIPGIKERMNLLEETIDHDAKIGHKTADTSFFGYKTHIAMNDNRLITAAVVTTGEKSEQNGVVVKTVLGDATYSGKDNLSYAKKKTIKLVAKLNPKVSKGGRKESDGFTFNKDADMMVCPAGELAVRKARQGKNNQNKNQVMTYYFDSEKCRKCPMREGCYAEGAKSKTYSISIKSDLHQEQIEF